MMAMMQAATDDDKNSSNIKWMMFGRFCTKIGISEILCQNTIKHQLYLFLKYLVIILLSKSQARLKMVYKCA